MTEFKLLMIENEISTEEAMRVFEMSERTLRRYKSGRVKAKKYMLIILENIELFTESKVA
jgi:hypothetical protein